MLKGIQITDNRKDQVRYSQTLSIPIFESIKPHNTPEKVLHFTAINYNVWKMGKPFNQASTILKLDISSPWNVKLAQLREVQHTRYDVAHTVSHIWMMVWLTGSGGNKSCLQSSSKYGAASLCATLSTVIIKLCFHVMWANLSLMSSVVEA